MTQALHVRAAAMIFVVAAALAGCVITPPATPETATLPGDGPGPSIPIDEVPGYMNRQRDALALALQAERAYDGAQLRTFDDLALLVRLSSDALFRVASTELRPDGRVTLEDIARVLARYRKTILYIAGHTDSTGKPAYNQRLSSRRARAVVDFLASRGVARIRMWPSGHAARESVASNRTTEGRRRNRRIDIVIKPIIRGLESSAYRAPLSFDRPSDAAGVVQ